MKIKTDTPEEPIAGETPWFIAIMLLLITLTLAAIALLTMTRHRAGLIFVYIGGRPDVGAMGVFVERLQNMPDARTETLTMRCKTTSLHTPANDRARAEFSPHSGRVMPRT